MNCKYYDGNSEEFMKCLDSQIPICDSHCKVQGESRLRKYTSLSKRPNSETNNFKDEFYKTETQCFICGTTATESIEHIYPQSENIGDLSFRNSCPSNMRRACTICNGYRGNEWFEFIDDKKKVHAILQEYDILNDEEIYYNFQLSEFEFVKSNIYSSMYLNEKCSKKFKGLFQLDYDLGFEGLVITKEIQFSKILENTVRKETGEEQCNIK